MPLTVKVIADGHKNATVQVSGVLDTDVQEPEVFIDLSTMNPPVKGVKVES